MNDACTDHEPVEAGIRRTELLISYTLRIGVMVSLLLIALGMSLSFARHPEYLTSRTVLTHLTTHGVAVPHTLVQLAAGLKAGRGQSIVLLGLLLLIATPVIRVAITSTVLLLLLLSFFLGHVTQ